MRKGGGEREGVWAVEKSLKTKQSDPMMQTMEALGQSDKVSSSLTNFLDDSTPLHMRELLVFIKLKLRAGRIEFKRQNGRTFFSLSLSRPGG